MKLEEKHKEFVVRHFACFTKLANIVDAFMEEFENELPTLEREEIPTLEEMIAEELSNADLPDEDWSEEEPNFKSYFINKFIKKHKEEFREKHGDEADKILNEEALKEFEQDLRERCINSHWELSLPPTDEDIISHKKQLRENLFNRFRRLHIDHPQFPNKYRALFHQTWDEHCANYRTPNLNISDNLTRELEILYGYQKHLIFQLENPKESMKHISLAHQILKTIVAHNAVNGSQEVVDITPQNTKALEDTQKVIEEQLNEIERQLEELKNTPTH